MFRPYSKYKDRGVMFFSAASPKDSQIVLDAGLDEMLVSYFYIRKRKRAYDDDILPQLFARDGLFMTDSGGFSFMEQLDTLADKDHVYKEEFWLPYLEEYVQWLHDHYKYIFVAANLDLDAYLGRDKILEWNEKYFKPLEKYINICYVVQRDWKNEYNDYTGLKRYKEYLDLYDYVAVNQMQKQWTTPIFEQCRIKKKLVHGLAWTSIPMLKSQPLFSVDSSSWLSGQRYGITYQYDGVNFRMYDKKSKFRRKGDKIFCRENNIDYTALMNDEDAAVTRYNVIQWKGARDNYMKAANMKLWNQSPSHYEKNKIAYARSLAGGAVKETP